MTSDLFGIAPGAIDTFYCGNFGLLLLGLANQNEALAILRRMAEITMIRGAQSGGVVTYTPGDDQGPQGVRSRVVNGKRTNLADLIHRAVARKERSKGLIVPRFYAGHAQGSLFF